MSMNSLSLDAKKSSEIPEQKQKSCFFCGNSIHDKNFDLELQCLNLGQVVSAINISDQSIEGFFVCKNCLNFVNISMLNPISQKISNFYLGEKLTEVIKLLKELIPKDSQSLVVKTKIYFRLNNLLKAIRRLDED